jgi:cyclomaltodextrinase
MNNNDSLSDQAQNLKTGKYRHFKGHDVEVLGVARHSEDPAEEFVVYTHDGRYWIRPLSMFLERVEREGYNGPRFVYAGNRQE